VVVMRLHGRWDVEQQKDGMPSRRPIRPYGFTNKAQQQVRGC